MLTHDQFNLFAVQSWRLLGRRINLLWIREWLLPDTSVIKVNFDTVVIKINFDAGVPKDGSDCRLGAIARDWTVRCIACRSDTFSPVCKA
ncbi:UNVERIFIED_CONTAM: hypothetical protein Sindi_0599100 [Sesamum indicum]